MSHVNLENPMTLKGKHILITLIAFFGVVIAVNVFFVVVALDTWTGLTTPKSYLEGLNYNSLIHDAERQKQQGWSAEVSVQRVAEDPGVIAVTAEIILHGRDGEGLPPLNVILGFRHPINETWDQNVKLTADGDGVYRGTAVLPVAGNWHTRLTATGQDGSFRQDDSFWIK